MRQTDLTLVIVDRHKAWVAALISAEPERLPGPMKARICKVGPV